MDWIGRLIGTKMDKDKDKLIVLLLLAVIITALATYSITKDMTEKQTEKLVLQNINNAYQQCQQTCGLKTPAFTSLDGKRLDCICLEFADGNSINNIIQG